MFSVVSLFLPQNLSMPKSLLHEPKGFGIGIYMGEPTGLAALNFSHRHKSITRQIYISWNIQKDQVRGVLDQVWTVYTSRLEDGTQFPVYIGGRGWCRINESNTTIGFTGFYNSFGVGIPVGALYQHQEVGIEGYVELTPVLQILPNIEFGMQAGVGVRFYPSF